MLPMEDVKRIKNLLEQVHFHRAKLRFWNTPDDENVWRKLMDMSIDILGTDDPCRLADFLE